MVNEVRRKQNRQALRQIESARKWAQREIRKAALFPWAQWLLDNGYLARWEGAAALAGLLAETLLFTLLLGDLCRLVVAAALLLLLASQMVKSMLDCFLLWHVRPGYVLRMEMERPVQPESKTLCVMSVLLYAPEAGVEAARLLEQNSLANRHCGKTWFLACYVTYRKRNRQKWWRTCRLCRRQRQRCRC